MSFVISNIHLGAFDAIPKNGPWSIARGSTLWASNQYRSKPECVLESTEGVEPGENKPNRVKGRSFNEIDQKWEKQTQVGYQLSYQSVATILGRISEKYECAGRSLSRIQGKGAKEPQAEHSRFDIGKPTQQVVENIR